MKEQDFKIRTKIIKETFNDSRRIKCITPEKDRKLDDNIYPGGDLFTTEDGEFIDLEFQMEDFNESELVKYVEFAEALYKKHQKQVSIYLLCPDTVNVLVRECEIKSEAEFTIKLACIQENPAHIILDIIKNKINSGELLDGDDLHALSMLPIMCKEEDRNYFRKEYFKIINKLHY
jgi:hypothetical protein